ncbi:hypothetical protein J8I87_13675 [Paraburkholderia sp. LEh10]|uniref:hypothetical protein n=1 Tax=Paraburkholderia sp. LEh10 TaxID=2821353 RepID=UPI001AEB6C43|nr:hypothetical protein [Paraburkholderia sp. LEh10]MBP0590749.1 hypothetical protein [Paraburkholderia sp. LEh10]
MKLTASQLEAYERDGFVVLPELFSTAFSSAELPRVCFDTLWAISGQRVALEC